MKPCYPQRSARLAPMSSRMARLSLMLRQPSIANRPCGATASALSPIRAARAEGIFLDPTYTGKAMAGYVDHFSKGHYNGADAALFLHTGGASSLFTAGAEVML